MEAWIVKLSDALFLGPIFLYARDEINVIIE